LAISWNWRTIDRDVIKIGPYSLEANPYYFELLWREWWAWRKWYLPSWSLKGKTVLDVGAGCGETALFYFRHGAAKVIAVEPNPSLTPILKRNRDRNHWNMEVVEAPFELSMLAWNYDFMKMDGEGCEDLLLKVESVPPCAIEAHDKPTVDALERRFGMRVLPQKTNWIVQNFSEKPTHSRE
jgi:predicted RNA methylase